MARSLVRDREAELGELLFGNRLERVSIQELERRTGISRNTLYKWKASPYKIPAGKLLVIVKALRMDPEKQQKIFECI